MDGGDVDKFREGSRKMKIVSRIAEKVMIPGHLVWGTREYHEMQESGQK